MASRFSFSASALGIGGFLRRGKVVTVVPSLASVALAPTGGEGAATRENHNANGISFSSASSRVIGYQVDDDRYTTIAEVQIANLNVFDRLTVTFMKGSVQSNRDLRSLQSEFQVSLMYAGVRFDDRPLFPQIDRELCAATTFDAFTKQMKKESRVHAQRLGAKEKDLKDVLNRGASDEPLFSYAVGDVERPDREELVGFGGVIFVPGFGTLHFGELIVTAARRRLNLLRIELGKRFGNEKAPATGRRRALPLKSASEMRDTRQQSNDQAPEVAPKMMTLMSSTDDPDDGSVTAGSAEGNGTPIWPDS